jgi:hypothetical protein
MMRLGLFISYYYSLKAQIKLGVLKGHFNQLNYYYEMP